MTVRLIEELPDGRIVYAPSDGGSAVGRQVGQFVVREDPLPEDLRGFRCHCGRLLPPLLYRVDILVPDGMPPHDAIGVLPTRQAQHVFADSAWHFGEPGFDRWFCAQVHSEADWIPFHVWQREHRKAE